MPSDGSLQPIPGAVPLESSASLQGPGGRLSRVAVLSLYEGDQLNRLWALIGLGTRRPSHWAIRALILPLITWVPMAIMALCGAAGPSSGAVDASNFFADFAAYAQFWIGLPLFVLAEAVVSVSTRSASIDFAASGVIRARDLPRLDVLQRMLSRVQRKGMSDVICLLLGALLSMATVWPEIHGHSGLATWHTVNPGAHGLSAAGWWEFCFALPLLNYWWLRHIWKVILWWSYLRSLSRFRLDLVATHPDLTGGIGFVSTVQGHFAWLLLAYGITNVAATVGYKLAIEGASVWMPPVWGPLVGYVLVGPLLFLLPLFMFTRQLYRTKRATRRIYRRRVMEQAQFFEAKILSQPPRASLRLAGAVDLSMMAQFAKLFDDCQKMRVVPFDWRSVSQLVGSTLGSVVSIVPALHLQGPLAEALSLLQKLLSSAGH